MATGEASIIYLEKDRLFFFDGTKIFKLDFTPEVLHDMDVLNQDAMIALIFQFIDANKIAPSRFLFVLSESVLFSMDSKETDQVKLDFELRNFTEMVPFDRVIAKEYKTEKGARMVGVNRDVIDTISESFVNKGFSKDGVVPALLYGNFGLRAGLDIDTANYFLSNQDHVKNKSMIEEGGSGIEPIKKTFKVEVGGKNKNLPYLLVGFGVLLLILLVLIFLRK